MSEELWRHQRLVENYRPHGDPRLVFEHRPSNEAGRWVWTGDTRDEDYGKALNEEMKDRWNALVGVDVQALPKLIDALTERRIGLRLEDPMSPHHRGHVENFINCICNFPCLPECPHAECRIWANHAALYVVRCGACGDSPLITLPCRKCGAWAPRDKS